MTEESGRSRFPVPTEISQEQLERIIHRAAELQFGRGEAYDILDVEEVQRIAEEVGLEGKYVRQALAEVRADELVPSRPEDRSFATRLWGEAAVVEIRVVPGTSLWLHPRVRDAHETRWLARGELRMGSRSTSGWVT